MHRKLSENRAKLLAGDGWWFRFTGYEIVKTDSGHSQFVRPTKDSEIVLYRPFDTPKEILKEYLELGRLLDQDHRFPRERNVPAVDDIAVKKWFLDRESKRARATMSFAEKFGLPGTLWQIDPQVDERSEWNESEEKFQEPSRVFVPNSRWSSFLGPQQMMSDGIQESRQFLASFLAERYSISDALTFDRKFLKAYAESVSCVSNDATDLLSAVTAWRTFKASGDDYNDLHISPDGMRRKVGTWRDVLNRDLAAGNVNLHIRLDRIGPRLDYGFRSLISALRIMLVLDIVGQQRVRRCALAECETVFIAKGARSRHCSDNCSNRDRQRTWQTKQKNARVVKKRLNASKND